MMFARSIGDPNRIYYDESYASQTTVRGIIAPPTFVQAAAQFDPEYPMRPRIGEPWIGSGRLASGLIKDHDVVPDASPGTAMMAEQHFEYHRPLRPGDVLSVTSRLGSTWQKQGKRAGRLTFTERIIEYRDWNGELVVTVRNVVVQTERPVDG